jgi:hypothetical protein
MDQAAEAFLKYDYAQTVDLGKAFITLLSAILVLSVTFAEKIINWEKSDRIPKILLLMCWGLLIFSIILCGASLNVIFATAVAVAHPLGEGRYWGVPVYGAIVDYLDAASFAWFVMGLAGCTFVLSVILLPVVAILKMRTP